MKIGNLVKTAVKWGPVMYPIIKKILDSKKARPTTTSRPTTTRRK